MTDDLSPTQALALWGLLARQGRAPEADVKPKADRDWLVGKGFVSVEKKTATLSDKGWNWAGEHFDTPGLSKQPVLSLFLARLGAHLKASGGTLAEFIGEAPPLPQPRRKPVKEPKPPKAKAPPKPKVAELRQMIEDAYLRASGGTRSEPVRLSKLRAELGDLDRKIVDDGLARIVKGGKKERASLSPMDDNKAVDAAEREAAFSPAGEPFHLISIA